MLFGFIIINTYLVVEEEKLYSILGTVSQLPYTWKSLVENNVPSL